MLLGCKLFDNYSCDGKAGNVGDEIAGIMSDDIAGMCDLFGSDSDNGPNQITSGSAAVIYEMSILSSSNRMGDDLCASRTFFLALRAFCVAAACASRICSLATDFCSLLMPYKYQLV